MQLNGAQRVPRYDEDFYAWTQHQAKLLRSAETPQIALSHGLDLAHLAEEIEDLGKSELRGAMNLIQQIMVHMIKAASDREGRAGGHCRMEAKIFHSELLRFYEPSMRQKIELQKLWSVPSDIADSALRDHGLSCSPNIPQNCPFTLDGFVSDHLRFEDAVANLKGVSPRE